jgi:hypothetical protein
MMLSRMIRQSASDLAAGSCANFYYFRARSDAKPVSTFLLIAL